MAIGFQVKPDDVLSEEEFVLTIPEIAQRLSISESAARALLEAAVGRSTVSRARAIRPRLFSSSGVSGNISSRQLGE
jgi:hypothetical protein